MLFLVSEHRLAKTDIDSFTALCQILNSRDTTVKLCISTRRFLALLSSSKNTSLFKKCSSKTCSIGNLVADSLHSRFLSIKNGFCCSMPTRLHKIALLFSMTSLIFLLSMRTRIAFSSLTSMLVLGKVTLFGRFPQLVGSPLPSTLLLVSLPSNILPAVHPASTLLWLLNSSRKKFRLSSKDLF